MKKNVAVLPISNFLVIFHLRHKPPSSIGMCQDKFRTYDKQTIILGIEIVKSPT
ncbi:unnamed protein product, partial [Ixodes persulcatus]